MTKSLDNNHLFNKNERSIVSESIRIIRSSMSFLINDSLSQVILVLGRNSLMAYSSMASSHRVTAPSMVGTSDTFFSDILTARSARRCRRSGVGKIGLIGPFESALICSLSNAAPQELGVVASSGFALSQVISIYMTWARAGRAGT